MSMMEELRSEHAAGCQTWTSDQVIGDIARLLLWVHRVQDRRALAGAVYGELGRRSDLVRSCLERQSDDNGVLLSLMSMLNGLQRRILATGSLSERDVSAAVEVMRLSSLSRRADWPKAVPRADIEQLVKDLDAYASSLPAIAGGAPDREATWKACQRIAAARAELGPVVRATASADTWQLVYRFLEACHAVAYFVDGASPKAEFRKSLAARSELLLDRVEVQRSLCAIHEVSPSARGERILTDVIAELDALMARGVVLRSDLEDFFTDLSEVLEVSAGKTP